MNSCGSGHWTNGSSSWDATVIFSGPGPWVQVQAQSLYEWDFTDLTVTGTPSPVPCEIGHYVFVAIDIIGYSGTSRNQNPVGQPCVDGGLGPLYETGTLTTAPVWIQTGVPVTLRLRMNASVQMGERWPDATQTLRYSVRHRLPTTGPIFILPEGYTANSPDLGIVNNRFGPVTITAATPQSFLDSLISVPGDLILADDADIASLSLPNLTSVGGDIIITGNTSLTTVGAPALEEVDGSIEIDGNPALEVVDFGALGGLGGDVTISGNGNPQLDFSSLGSLGGDVTISGNGDPQLDFSSLGSLGGDVTISGNGDPQLDFSGLVGMSGSITITDNNSSLRTGSLSFPALISVGGDLTVDTFGQPVLDFANAIVGGNTLLSGIGTGSVAARTAAGTTDILLGGLFSTHAIALPVGALLDPTPLTAHALEGEELDPAEGLDAQGQPATIDPLAGVRYIFGDATFTQPALVQITLDVEQLDEPLRTDALAAMAAGRLTMAVKGDGAGDVHIARTICPEGSGPETDGCIGIVLYDGEGMVIPWSSEDAPAFIQATALVTQFSGWTLSIVGSSCPADVNGDGELDVLDFLDYLDAFGQCEGQPVDCTVYGVKANFNGDDIIDVLDILDFFDAFGTGCG
ncbi:MAG: hypothetical protein KF902_00605 [Phycisphaeraceae bacterium]|nr:hypothetical protein [Phycisphaeraceae bacterium]